MNNYKIVYKLFMQNQNICVNEIKENVNFNYEKIEVDVYTINICSLLPNSIDS